MIAGLIFNENTLISNMQSDVILIERSILLVKNHVQDL